MSAALLRAPGEVHGAGSPRVLRDPLPPGRHVGAGARGIVLLLPVAKAADDVGVPLPRNAGVEALSGRGRRAVPAVRVGWPLAGRRGSRWVGRTGHAPRVGLLLELGQVTGDGRRRAGVDAVWGEVRPIQLGRATAGLIAAAGATPFGLLPGKEALALHLPYLVPP